MKTSPVAGSGSGSALRKNAGSGYVSGSTLKPIRNTAPRFKPKKVLTPGSYRFPAPSLNPDPDPLNPDPDPAFQVNLDPVPDPDSGF
jgi:hypothetical protein